MLQPTQNLLCCQECLSQMQTARCWDWLLEKKKRVHRGLGYLSTVTEYHTPTAPLPTHGNTRVNTPRNAIVMQGRKGLSRLEGDDRSERQEQRNMEVGGERWNSAFHHSKLLQWLRACCETITTQCHQSSLFHTGKKKCSMFCSQLSSKRTIFIHY